MSIEESELKNIPTNSLKVVGRNNKSCSRTVKMFEDGVIVLNAFACVQFIKGAELLNQKLKGLNRDYIEMVFKLIDGLSNKPLELKVKIEDLGMLRAFLEQRIQHCEKERDERNPAFNPDTYIGQKLLLLDLRELMLGEIVVIE